LHEGVNKRLRLLTNEIDDNRKQLDGQIVLVRRIEAVESKAQEIWEMMEDVKSGSQGGDATEHLQNDIKSVTNTIFALKSQINKEIHEFKDEVNKNF
jgi:hypothetical protein